MKNTKDNLKNFPLFALLGLEAAETVTSPKAAIVQDSTAVLPD